MKTADHTNMPCCKRCNIEFEERVRRGPIARYLFFWLPLKRYICLNCLRRYYVLDTKHRSAHALNKPYHHATAQMSRAEGAIYKLSSSNTGQ